MVKQRPSGQPLYNEVDYDDLVIHRSWRSFDTAKPDEVRYFMFELSQRNPGEREFSPVFFKATRMVRLVRVPRYLRNASNDTNGPGMVFEQMRDLLAALREQGVLFTNIIAKSPQLPLVFAYGVQGIGATPEEAQEMADEAFAVLDFQLSGTYQQLIYQPITVEEGELLARYQREWRHLAMARGRPLPASGSMDHASLLDGNRTDVESAQNQLESFIRGMSDRSFMLSLVTVPLSPAEISVAWRNITQKLSEVRSETHGQRAITAGVAFPLVMGTSAADQSGVNHSTSQSHGIGTSEGVNQSTAEGLTDTVGESHAQMEGQSESFTDTVGESVGVTDTVGTTETAGVTETDTVGTNQSVAEGEDQSTSRGVTQSVAHGQSESVTATESQSVGHTESQSVAATESESVTATESQSVTEGQTASVTETESVSQSTAQTEGQSVSQSESQTQGQSSGTNFSDTVGASETAGSTVSQTEGQSSQSGQSVGSSSGVSEGSNIGGGVPGVISGGENVGSSESWDAGANQSVGESSSSSAASSQSATNMASSSTGGSETVSSSATQGVTQGQSASTTESVGSSSSVGQTQGVSSSTTQGQSVGQTVGQSVTATQGQSATASQGQSVVATQGQSASTAAATSQSTANTVSQATSTTQSTSQAATQGTSTSQTMTQSTSQAQSTTQTAGTSQTASTNQDFSNAYAVAMSRTAGTTGSLAVAPNFGVSVSRNTLDSAKQFIGDLLDAQMKRYGEGLKSGAFLYQMFLICPDRETLLGGSGLLKSAFWGGGTAADQLPQPFHTIADFADEDEYERLLTHAAAWTTYRKREPVVELIEPFAYSSYLTPTEAASFCHPPVVEGPGMLAVHDSMPVLRMPVDRQDRDIFLGHVVNGERGRVSEIRFGLNLEEMNHALIAGVTGSGKALATDTPIPTPTGWTTMGQLQAGDEVFDETGTPRTVTFATDVMNDHRCYELTFSDGSRITADADHLWRVSDDRQRARTSRGDTSANSARAASYADAARRVRLLAHTHTHDRRTIDQLAELFAVPPAVVRKAITSGAVAATPVRRTVEQQYGTTTALMPRTGRPYRVADAADAVADQLEACAAAHDPAPVDTLLTTEQLTQKLAASGGRRNFSIAAAGALDTLEQDLPLDPYLLGVWLGDGASTSTRISVHPDDRQTIEEIRARGYLVRHDGDLTWTVEDPAWQQAVDTALDAVRDGYTYSSAARLAGAHPATVARHAKAAGLTPGDRRTKRPAIDRPLQLRSQLRQLGVLGDKHIPPHYLRASQRQRLELLRGIVDTDGHVAAGGAVTITLTNEQLARDVCELVRSLGIVPTSREGRATLERTDANPTWTVTFTTTQPVALLARKAERLPTQVRATSTRRSVERIDEVASVPVRCIEVSAPSHLFLAGEAMVPTHNTTTLMRFLAEAISIEQQVTDLPTPEHPAPQTHTRRASILALDWMRNMRDLAAIPELANSGRFHFYSVLNPELGAFRFNPLEVPADTMSTAEWLNAQADNFTASFNLGEFGRSLIAEFLTELYGANRLETTVLRPETTDPSTGQVLRPAVTLPPIPRDQLPASAIQVDQAGNQIANAFTYTPLSRTVGLSDLAVLVAAAVERAATQEGARLMGQQMRDRLQSLWRRMQYFAPNGQYAQMLGADVDLNTRSNLGVTDLIDPDRGLVTVVETDGLDLEARRLILGSVMLAIYRYGLHHGKGVFDHDGRGPGCFVVMEESHELFGQSGNDEDSYSASTRTALYEGMFRRVRALGLRLVAVAQQPSTLPDAVTANINTVFIHKVRAKEDRDKSFALLNWMSQIGQNLREWRYLGEMPTGYCIARLDARQDYTESAPIQFKTDMALLNEVTDKQLADLARRADG